MTSALQIPALAKLQKAGFNPLVLRAMEDNAMMQAIEMRLMKGISAHPSNEVTQFAESLLPQGEQLHSLYAQTKADIRDFPAQDLQMYSEHLQRVAGDLEFAGARLLAANADGATVSSFAQAQHSLSERYADIIDAAQQIEKAGGPAPIHQLSLLTERPDGPLEAFYDKAQALLRERQQTYNFDAHR